MATAAFLVFAVLLVGSAVLVVVHPNPVKSAMALVVVLFLLAVAFVLLDAHMIAVLQVIVYAGAIVVLFLFVIMLLNLQDEDRLARVETRPPAMRVVAWLGGAALAFELAWLFLSLPLGERAAATAGYGGAEAVARSLFTDFLLPFELTSVLLLVAIVGAVLLAQHRKPA
jgi:NADH-quinone oxidoreductase subunit J